MSEIGTVIALKRESLGMTQKELAEKSNVSVKTLRKIENNENDNFLIATLERIAKALGCTTVKIFRQAEEYESAKFIEHMVLGSVSKETALKKGYTEKEYYEAVKDVRHNLEALDDFIQKLQEGEIQTNAFKK